MNFKRNAENNPYLRLKASALRMLVRRDHSRTELRQKLALKDCFTTELFNQLIAELERLRYLPDEDILAKRLASQWQAQGKGSRWITMQLKKRGLPDVPVTDDDQLEAAKRFLEKKFKGVRPKSREERARFGRSLLSRGFSTAIVATVLKQ